MVPMTRKSDALLKLPRLAITPRPGLVGRTSGHYHEKCSRKSYAEVPSRQQSTLNRSSSRYASEKTSDIGLGSHDAHTRLAFLREKQDEVVSFIPERYQSRFSQNTIDILRSRDAVKTARRQIISSNKKLALVPTMGALHAGHLSLVKAAAAENDVVWVSIFLNPTQFGPTEDLATYPQTWDVDMAMLDVLNQQLADERYKGRVEAVFAPLVGTMYPGTKPGDAELASQSFVTIDSKLTGILEGAARPVFFRGVATVVMKLFNIVRPDTTYFGQKDIQQLAVIYRMVKDFMLDVDVCPVPIERDEFGMALSSRNAYLGERRRRVGLVLSKALAAGQQAFEDGHTSRKDILGAALQVFEGELKKQSALPPSERARFEVEYVSLSGFHNLTEVEDVNNVQNVVLSGTIKMLPLEEPRAGEILGLGGDAKPVRLLDNVLWRNPSA